MSNTTVWCWRFYIVINDDLTEADDPPDIVLITLDKYNDDFIDAMYLYYDFLCGQYRWYITDTDLVEVPRQEAPVKHCWQDPFVIEHHKKYAYIE